MSAPTSVLNKPSSSRRLPPANPAQPTAEVSKGENLAFDFGADNDEDLSQSIDLQGEPVLEEGMILQQLQAVAQDGDSLEHLDALAAGGATWEGVENSEAALEDDEEVSAMSGSIVSDRTLLKEAYPVDALFDDIQLLGEMDDEEGEEDAEIAASKSDSEGLPRQFDVNFEGGFIDRSARNPGLVLYMRQAARAKLLTPAEEIDLAVRARAGDQQAVRKFIEANLRLVISIARRYQRDGSSMALVDLVQEGNIGLMTAVRKFDPDLGHRFSTYASYWIQSVIQYQVKTKQNLIAVPGHIHDQMNKISLRIAREEKAGEPEEVIKASREELKAVRERFFKGSEQLLTQSTSLKSLDSPVGTDEESENMPSLGSTLIDASQDPERRTEIIQAIGLMSKAMEWIGSEAERDAFLAERAKQVEAERTPGAAPRPTRSGPDPHSRGKQRFVFECHSGLNDEMTEMTLQEVGEKIGVTRERVRQLYALANETFLRHLSRLANGLENLPFDVRMGRK